MKDNFLSKYFKREERKVKKLHHEVDPSSWPEYLTATQSRVRRVMAERRAAPRVGKVASSVENLYMDETAQDVAHTQVSKSRRGNLPRKVTATKVLAWGGWGIAMATFASSLLLNFPFGAGAFILKAIPGEPRTGEITVMADTQAALQPGDTTSVSVVVKGVQGKNLQNVTTELTFDPGALQVQDVTVAADNFPKILDNHYDTSEGKIFLSLESGKTSQSDSLKLATISFKVKDFVGETNIHVIPDSHITEQQKGPAIPKDLGSLALKISSKNISPVTVPLSRKQDAVTINGNLDDWRDVIAYNPVSFRPQGTVISGDNIKEGRITSPSDFSGVLQLAQNNKNYYLAFSATDDEVLNGDKLAVKFDAQVFEIPVFASVDALYSNNGIEARTTKSQDGYVTEIKIPKSLVASSQTTLPFNFEVHDVDSQDSGVVVLSFPNDSRVAP